MSKEIAILMRDGQEIEVLLSRLALAKYPSHQTEGRRFLFVSENYGSDAGQSTI